MMNAVSVSFSLFLSHSPYLTISCLFEADISILKDLPVTWSQRIYSDRGHWSSLAERLVQHSFVHLKVQVTGRYYRKIKVME